jgi:hypothetical protein
MNGGAQYVIFSMDTLVLTEIASLINYITEGWKIRSKLSKDTSLNKTLKIASINKK